MRLKDMDCAIDNKSNFNTIGGLLLVDESQEMMAQPDIFYLSGNVPDLDYSDQGGVCTLSATFNGVDMVHEGIEEKTEYYVYGVKMGHDMLAFALCNPGITYQCKIP